MSNRLKYTVSSLLICLIFFQCQDSTKTTTPAFYHWKTNVQLDSSELDYLNHLNVKKLYVKFFDIDWDFQLQKALPQASVQFSNPLNGLQIIPTIFITNRTILQLEDYELDNLAANISSKINDLAPTPFSEIQLDCDWTPKTKEKYFKILQEIKKLLPNTILSATIRLHQVKYFDLSGVPPVDKGMLMFYNMGDVEKMDSKNSILDLEIAKQYMVNFDRYPIHLDVALPLFSWAVLFRDKKMIRLINHVEEEIKKDTSRFLSLDDTHFEVKKSTYLDGHYLYKGDLLRVESVDAEQLTSSAALLKKHLKGNDLTISFYHLDSTILNKYPYVFLEEICHHFH